MSTTIEQAIERGERDGTRVAESRRDTYIFGEEHDAAANHAWASGLPFGSRERCYYVVAFRKAFTRTIFGDDR